MKNANAIVHLTLGANMLPLNRLVKDKTDEEVLVILEDLLIQAAETSGDTGAAPYLELWFSCLQALTLARPEYHLHEPGDVAARDAILRKRIVALCALRGKLGQIGTVNGYPVDAFPDDSWMQVVTDTLRSLVRLSSSDEWVGLTLNSLISEANIKGKLKELETELRKEFSSLSPEASVAMIKVLKCEPLYKIGNERTLQGDLVSFLLKNIIRYADTRSQINFASVLAPVVNVDEEALKLLVFEAERIGNLAKDRISLKHMLINIVDVAMSDIKVECRSTGILHVDCVLSHFGEVLSKTKSAERRKEKTAAIRSHVIGWKKSSLMSPCVTFRIEDPATPIGNDFFFEITI